MRYLQRFVFTALKQRKHCLLEEWKRKWLWRRSENIGFRYVEIVGDGDAKTLNELKAANVYDCEIKKIECVNHVGKRMGTALRKLVENEKKLGITLGGKKHGSLTEGSIKK